MKNEIIKDGTIDEVVPKYVSNQSKLFKTVNLLPGSPSFADFHDALNLPGIWNQLSIPPAYIVSQFNALAPYYSLIMRYNEIMKNNDRDNMNNTRVKK